MRRISFVFVILSVLGPAASAPAVHAPNAKVRHSTSTNWGGYAATGRTYTSVSARWTQPVLSCTTQNTWSSFWVGLDGYGSNTVEQTGTEADCRNGAPVYSAWYEMYPKWPVTISIPVRAGDVFVATVTAAARKGTFTLTLTNITAGRSFTTTQNAKQARRSSAEIIAEAPWSNGVLPLSNFGTASFTNATVDGAALGGFAPDPITMVTSDGTAKATPGAITGGTNFDVTWSHV